MRPCFSFFGVSGSVVGETSSDVSKPKAGNARLLFFIFLPNLYPTQFDFVVCGTRIRLFPEPSFHISNF